MLEPKIKLPLALAAKPTSAQAVHRRRCCKCKLYKIMGCNVQLPPKRVRCNQAVLQSTLPVTNCEGERSLSPLKGVKH